MWRGWLLCNTDAYICIYMTEQITKDMCRRGQRHGIACGYGNLPAGLQHRFGGRQPHAVRSADNQDFFVF